MEKGGRVILLVGPSGSGKSTYVGESFRGVRVLNADRIREKITGDASDQTRNRAVFEEVRRELAKTLRDGRTVVVDNTNVQQFAREELYRIARLFNAPVEARVMGTPLDECLRRNEKRDRRVPEDVIRRQFDDHLVTLTQLPGEGLASIEIITD